MENTARAFDVKDYVRIFSKRKWFILLVTLAVSMVGGLYAAGYRATYRASAVVLIRQQPIERIRFGEGEIEGENVRRELTLETQAQIATSYASAVRTAKKLGARESGEKMVADPSEIKNSLAAYPNKPDRLFIEATNVEKDKALAYANETADTFVQVSAELRRADVTVARTFLEEQCEAYSAKLDRLEHELASYQQTVGIVVPEAEATAKMTELQSYEHALREAETELQALKAKQGELDEQHQKQQPTVTFQATQGNPERDMIAAQMRQEEINLATLRARYKDTHPAVGEALSRIEQLQERMNAIPQSIDTPTYMQNPLYASLPTEIAGVKVSVAEAGQRVAKLNSIVSALKNQTADLPRELSTIARLQAQITLARRTYETFLEQLEQNKLREAIKESGASVIDRAVDAEEIKPGLGRTVLFAFFIGLFIGMMVALLLEALDDTFHSPEDITHYTDVPFLGMVPLLNATGGGLITITAPKSPPAEAYRVLRSNIHFAQADSPAHTLLVTSAGASEGKSLTAANLAVVFAQAGQKVLLIDADLRRPSQQRLFGVDRDYGLTNVLIGENSLEDVMIEFDQVPGLFIMPTGPLPPNPADLLGSNAMLEVLSAAMEFADIVILDSPPAIVLTDAVLLSSRIDQTILVAECDHVSRTAFIEMIRLIRNARGNILGTILNKLKLNASDYYYYYYYYDYAHETPLPTNISDQAETIDSEELIETLLSDEMPTKTLDHLETRDRDDTSSDADDDQDDPDDDPDGDGPDDDNPQPTPPADTTDPDGGGDGKNAKQLPHDAAKSSGDAILDDIMGDAGNTDNQDKTTSLAHADLKHQNAITPPELDRSSREPVTVLDNILGLELDKATKAEKGAAKRARAKTRTH